MRASDLYGFPKYPPGFEHLWPQDERAGSIPSAMMYIKPEPISNPMPARYISSYHASKLEKLDKWRMEAFKKPNLFFEPSKWDKQIQEEMVETINKQMYSNQIPSGVVKDEEGVVQESLYVSARRFEELDIPEEVKEKMLAALYTEMKFDRPSQIQAATLPRILRPPYNSICAQAQNGCGKTVCFAVCIVARVDYSNPYPQAIVVVPMRELALQNEKVIQTVGKYLGITTISTAQTDLIHQEAQKIRKQVVVGTHGTLAIWNRKRWLSYEYLKILSLDEADNLLSREQFADETYRLIREIKAALRENHLQILMFSATFNDDIKKFATQICPEALKLWVPKEELSLDKIKQVQIHCRGLDEKIRTVCDLIFPNADKIGKTIIFVSSRNMARILKERLIGENWCVTSISGEMTYEDRDTVIEEFRNGTTRILITTDILSRGFDVSDVTLVVNFDMPFGDSFTPPQDLYLHRVGRTGRFTRKGAAFNLMSNLNDDIILQQICEYFNRTIPECEYSEKAILEVLVSAELASKESLQYY